MAYQIDKFNGSFLVTIDDQTINTTASDLKLVGRNYAGYGEIQNENFIHLLENFASTNAPPRSLEGQIWYDSLGKKLKYFNGQRYKSASGAEVSSTAPAGLSPGEFWFDSQEQQLYTWSGSDFVLVGPIKSSAQGETSVEPKTVKDLLGNNKNIIQFRVSNQTVAVFSKEDFILNPTLDPIEGFSNIKPGINLINIDFNGIQTTSAHRFWGTSTNSQRLNGFTSDDFLKSSDVEFKTQVKFLDSGILIGDQNDLRIRVVNGNEPIIENTLGGTIILRILTGAVPRDPLIIRDDGVFPGSNDQYFLGKPGIRWKEVNSETVRSQTFFGKLIGELEPPPPPPGQAQSFLRFKDVEIIDNFSMVSNSITPKSFLVNFSGGVGTINLTSGSIGTLDNFNIGSTVPRSGTFTSLVSSGTVTISSTANNSLSVSGGAIVSGNLSVNGTISSNSTGALKLPSGTSTQRPGSPVKGMIRFNDTLKIFEGYTGVEWLSIGSDIDEDYGLVTGLTDSFVDYGGLF
jgi:hypothetical protein